MLVEGNVVLIIFKASKNSNVFVLGFFFINVHKI